MDFAPAPRELDRDVDYIVAVQAIAPCSAWLSQSAGNIHYDNGNERTHSDLGNGYQCYRALPANPLRAAPFLRSVVLERRMLRKAEPSDGINTDPRLVNRIFGRLAQ